MAEHILHPVILKKLARQWLNEDTSSFDFAGAAVGEHATTTEILCKSAGIIAGIPFANAVFKELNCNVEWFVSEGSFLEGSSKVASVSGKSRHVLLAERPVLNCLARCSGIATITNTQRKILDNKKWNGFLACTRKTTPGFRLPEKYAVLIGGACNHRFDLSQEIMLKDNHIKIAGSVKAAVERVRKLSGFVLKIEVECATLEEAREAAQAGCDIVMLDNCKPPELHEVAKQLKIEYPTILIEGSGGVNEDNIADYAGPHIDIISTSSTVQGYRTLDFSMNVCC
ncbi:nicotinate-nucleotide pyrophosphorylase [carboxylating]-like isoform X1 [Limulus polyphemus]|uniref:Nicotinate-nucleotide pyrophosphorylase [carboxylating] n=1 Tax=Limulus polyphemus TaxID=6850 RepID=A0ABM1B101_LIMPO|nr:nicotinate-nucleotide pyrophosphorylase [carboxylating]-like isoform X1 [Limulus polyphemus]